MSVIPAVAAPGALKVPAVQERLLSNGLRVLAVRRASVPVVELRLRIPTSAADPKSVAAKSGRDRAAATLLAETMLTGTESHDRSRLATELQALGAGLSANIDNDRLALVGSVLAPNLKQLLALLAEVIHTASYPKREVSGERDRLVDELAIARSQPAVLAREALLARLYGKHPYAVEIPSPEALEAITAKQLRTLHERAVSPKGAVLTLVGDLRPAAALDAVEAALGGWSGRAAKAMPKLPKHTPGGVMIVDRPERCRPTSASGPRPCRARRQLRGAAGRQRRVRRLLLLAAGQQHPRGQGLHVFAPQLHRARRGGVTAHRRG